MLIFFIVKMLLVGEAHCDVMEDLLKSVRTLNDKVDHVRFELATTNTKVNQLQDDLKSQNVEMTENLKSLWLSGLFRTPFQANIDIEFSCQLSLS